MVQSFYVREEDRTHNICYIVDVLHSVLDGLNLPLLPPSPSQIIYCKIKY